MGGFFSDALILDNTLQLKLKQLKLWGYLRPGEFSFSYEWTRNGERIGRVRLHTKIDKALRGEMILDYSAQGNPIRYPVQIETTGTNLGGKQQLFICPKTGAKARKLYLVGAYFLSRSAANQALYECQTKSHKYRQLEKLIGATFSGAEIYDKLYSKRIWTYGGRITKPVQRLLSKLPEDKAADIRSVILGALKPKEQQDIPEKRISAHRGQI